MDGWERFGPRGFFHLLRGSQRAYSLEAVVAEDQPRPPQAMSKLPRFNPGVISHEDHRDVVQPVRNRQDEDGNN